MAWGAGPHAEGVHHLEDGFLRSKGLGAQLVPPLSLVLDRKGIYFDPTRSSDLETLIAKSLNLPPQERQRAANLQNRLLTGGISKYNPPDPRRWHCPLAIEFWCLGKWKMKRQFDWEPAIFARIWPCCATSAQQIPMPC